MTDALAITPDEIWRISGKQWWLKPWLMYRSRWRLALRTAIDHADPKLLGIIAISLLGCLVLWTLFRYWLLVYVVCAAIVSGMWLRVVLKQRRYFWRIIKEVERHNKLVNALNVLDQLVGCGHDLATTDREAVTQALAVSQQNLIRALNTERILRESPDFEPQNFSIDFSVLQTATLDDISSEYGQLFEEALQVSVAVQDDLSSLK